MPEVGERYLGTVVKIAQFGAFVSLLPGKDGLLHVSELRKLTGKRVENVEDVLSVGQKIMVELVKIDDRGKLSLAPVVEGEVAATDSEQESVLISTIILLPGEILYFLFNSDWSSSNNDNGTLLS